MSSCEREVGIKEQVTEGQEQRQGREGVNGGI